MASPPPLIRRALAFVTGGVLVLTGLGAVATSPASAAPGDFTNKTTGNGLGNNALAGVYAIGSTVYAATSGGLSISTNGGTSFTNKTTANGLGNNTVKGVFAIGSTVYAATGGGLSISTDGGTSFTNKTTSNGLGNNTVNGVYASGSKVYAATQSGLSISTNGGESFVNRDFGSNVRGVYAIGDNVYAATDGGLSISTDGGANFTNKTTANGLALNSVLGVYASGSMVYAATPFGLSISTNGGTSFTSYTTSDGLGNHVVYGVYAIGSTVYAATSGGLSIGVIPTPPGALSGVAAAPGNTTASVSWTADDTGGSAVTRVEFALDDTVTVDDSTTNIAGPQTLTGLANGQTYTVYARAVNAIGTGPWSAGTSVTPRTTPSAPTGLVATPGNASASIAFTAGSNGGSPVTNYAYTLDDSTWIPISPDDTTTPVTITGLANGTTYSVKLRAINAAGAGTASVPVPVTPATTPSVLTGVAAVAGNGTAAMSWTVDDTGGSAVTRIEFALDDIVTVDDSTTNVAGPHTLTGLVNGQTYTVYARAVNTNGAGPWSAGTPVTPQAPSPPVPPRPMPAMTPTAQTITGTAGTPITATSTFTLENFTLIPRYTVYPALPAGLTIDSATGVVTGTPGEAYPSTRHWITATAGGNSESAYSTLQVTIDPAPEPPPTPTPTIAIVGIRSANGARIEVNGTSTHLAGTTLTPWFRFAGQATYRPGAALVTVASDGTFTWSRTANKKTYVYFTHDTVKSNTSIIAAR